MGEEHPIYFEARYGEVLTVRALRLDVTMCNDRCAAVNLWYDRACVFEKLFLQHHLRKYQVDGSFIPFRYPGDLVPSNRLRNVKSR